jgi:decaprenylphospho-beta-D-ribofuranose 2-oxidase
MIDFKKKIIYGWSKSHFSKCDYFETSNNEQIIEIFDFAKKNNKKIAFRAGGKSYGDNTLNKNNIVLKHTSKDNIFLLDEKKSEIVVSGSCTLIELIKFIVPKGLMLYVSPASQFITVAGSISNNVHGKNCPSKGYFGDYIEEIEILTPDKGVVSCSKLQNSEFFYSIISGLGAFGVILKTKVRLRKINTIKVNTDSTYVANINDAVEKSENLVKSHEYNIGSLNFTRFNNNSTAGRIYSSNFSDEIDLKVSSTDANILIYMINSGLLLNKIPLIDKLIEYFFSKITSRNSSNSKNTIQNFFSMNFLSDKYLPFYNNFFRHGFIEYQVLFNANNYLKAVHKINELIINNGYSSYMTSFKSFKNSDPKYIFGLSKNGYCLTLDIPFYKEKKFQSVIRKMNEITIKYEGQVYMGKTPCLNNQEFKAMYKNYNQFKIIKKVYDSNFIIVSDMINRVFNDIDKCKY